MTFQRKNSVVVKVSLVIFAACVAINFVVYWGMSSFSEPPKQSREVISQNIDLYLTILTRDLGPTPDERQLLDLAKRTNLDIAVKGPSFEMATQEYLRVILPSENTRRKKIRPPRPGPSRRGFRGPPKFKGHPYHSLKVAKTWYTFFAPKHARLSGPPSIIFYVLIIASGIVLISFFVIRYFLRPLHPLTEAVDAIAKGNLDHRVDVKGKDELWALAKGFNSMAEQIQKIIGVKERLLIDVSHELNSPVGRMQLAVDLLPDSEQKKRLASYTKEIQSIVGQILASARDTTPSDPFETSNVDLNALVQNQITLFNDQKGPSIIYKGAEKIEAELNEGRISTVVRNILDNALKYSSHQPKPVEVSLEENEKDCTLKIRDYGNGIPEDESKLIFDAFYRVDKSRSKETGGYGLGLNICQKIVKAHQGSMTIEGNMEPKGTLVTIVIPKHRANHT